MWLFTKFGFFSVTEVKQYGKPRKGEKRLPPGTIQVRARVWEDLENLRESYLPELTETIHIPGRDYPYRGYCQKDELAAAMVQIAFDIDYSNFKDQVKKEQGHHRSSMYMSVWSAMYRAEEKLAEKERKEEERKQQALPLFRNNYPEYLEPWIEDVWARQAEAEARGSEEAFFDDRSDEELEEAAMRYEFDSWDGRTEELTLAPDEIISEDPMEVQEAMMLLEARRR